MGAIAGLAHRPGLGGNRGVGNIEPARTLAHRQRVPPIHSSVFIGRRLAITVVYSHSLTYLAARNARRFVDPFSVPNRPCSFTSRTIVLSLTSSSPNRVSRGSRLALPTEVSPACNVANKPRYREETRDITEEAPQ
jgi:hypothetical protein